MFLNICCDKVLDLDSKQTFNCVLKTSFLIQNVQQALDILLEKAILIVLLLRNVMSTKYDD